MYLQQYGTFLEADLIGSKELTVNMKNCLALRGIEPRTFQFWVFCLAIWAINARPRNRWNRGWYVNERWLQFLKNIYLIAQRKNGCFVSKIVHKSGLECKIYFTLWQTIVRLQLSNKTKPHQVDKKRKTIFLGAKGTCSLNIWSYDVIETKGGQWLHILYWAILQLLL